MTKNRYQGQEDKAFENGCFQGNNHFRNYGPSNRRRPVPTIEGVLITRKESINAFKLGFIMTAEVWSF